MKSTNQTKDQQAVLPAADGKRALAVELVSVFLLAVVLLGLYWISEYNYLLFHSLAEGFSIVVACAIFILAWNSRGYMGNNYLLFVGIAYLFVGFVDALHTLAYERMGVFSQPGSNLATQLWIAARYLESTALLAAPIFLRRRVNAYGLLAGFGILTAVLLGLIFYWRVFPDCYVEPMGLTAFKKVSEYIICVTLLGAMALLLLVRREFNPRVLQLLAACIVVTIASEIAFTKYATAYDKANMVGHLLKIVSFYAIYKAIVQTGLVRPFNLLFRDLKKSEEQLKMEQERLYAVLDMLPGIVCLLAPGYKVRYTNGKFREVYGEPGGRRCYEILRGGSDPCRSCPTFEAFKTRRPQLWEWAGPNDRTYAVYANPFTDVDGSPLILKLAIDVTERKQAEAALRAAADFQKRLLTTAATAVFLVDSRRQITSVNKEFCSLTGFEEGDIIGKSCDVLRGAECTGNCSLMAPDTPDTFAKQQCTIRRKDGTPLTIIKNADAIRNGVGEITGAIESFVDVTSLVEAREAAEAASRAKSAFLANIGHELRTPLSAIIGFSDVLAREKCGPLNADQRDCLDDIHASAKHLLSLISDLLDLAKVEIGKSDLKLEPLMLYAEIEWSLLFVRQRAAENAIELSTTVPGNLPPVIANPRAVRQVLINLLTNAIKFTDCGGRVAVQARAEPGTVVVDVEDTGIGIAPDEIDKVFDAFERSSRTESLGIDGMGLGLPLVRGLVEAMGGTIEVVSEWGKGTRFTFALPRAPAPEEASGENGNDFQSAS